MSEEQAVSDQIPEEAPVQEEAAPEVDLSGVPENVREHVDPELYQADQDYQRAIEHGWKPQEVHEADGGDAADWTGYRQFNRRYDDRQTEKGLKTELSDMKAQMEAVLSVVQEDRSARVENDIETVSNELKTAIEDGDTAKALELQEKLNKLNAVNTTPAPQQPQEPPVVLQFRANNPQFDHNSPHFNRALNAALEDVVNAQWVKESNNGQNQLHEDTMQRILNESLAQVQSELGLNKPQQPKAPTVAKPSRSAPKADPASQLTGSALNTYTTIAGKYGKEAADKFAAKYVEGGQ